MSFAAYSAIPTLGDVLGNSYTETDTGDESFYLTDTSGLVDDATAFLMFEYAGYADYNSFGIYSGGTSMEIFNGSDSPTIAATLSWDILTNEVSLVGSAVSAFIDDTNFGFYIDAGPDGDRFFSEASLNPDGEDMMASYDVGAVGHPDLFGSNIVLAWEDVLLSNGGDGDYNDMVVGISDISGNEGTTSSVPEPGIPLLLSLGLLGIGLTRTFST